MTYWDTSCVLKLYVSEVDSKRWQELAMAEQEPLLCSSLLLAELAFALAAKDARGDLVAGGASALRALFHDDVEKGRFRLIPCGSDVLEEAARIAELCYAASPRIPLRTLDGLHLATACLLHCRDLVTTDRRMRDAARLLGITVTTK
jgi:predicted nucleic acid-binding protein